MINMQSLYRITPAILIVLATILFLAASQSAISNSASVRYKACSDLAISNPAKAYEEAKEWRIKNADSPVARHCEALALYGLKSYKDSASEFETLAQETMHEKPNLAVGLFLQGAAARRSQADYKTEAQDLEYAQKLDPENAAVKILLIELAQRKSVSGTP